MERTIAPCRLDWRRAFRRIVVVVLLAVGATGLAGCTSEAGDSNDRATAKFATKRMRRD
jgi:hypothetical protein